MFSLYSYISSLFHELGKSVGVENLPNEILRNENLVIVLFNLCFFFRGMVPKSGCESIVCQILKTGKDYRDPYGYMSINLMSTAAKLFHSILNKRLVNYLEQEIKHSLRGAKRFS